MPSGKPHPPDIKAQVLGALMAGDSTGMVSDRFDIPESTIKAWKADLHRENILDNPEKKAELGVLVSDCLTEMLTTLASQARFARDERWLRRQRAGEVAIFFGVLADKAVRILAALEPADATANGYVVDIVAPDDVPELLDG